MSSLKINIYEKNKEFKKCSLIISKKKWYIPLLKKIFFNKINIYYGILSRSKIEDECDFYEYKNPNIITNILINDLKRFFSRIKFIKQFKYKNIDINRLLEEIINNNKNINLELYLKNQNPYIFEDINRKYYEYISKIHIKYTSQFSKEIIYLESFLLKDRKSVV